MSDKKDTITFGRQEIDPAEAEGFRQKMAQARSGVGALKSNTPVGHVPKMTGLPPLQRQTKQEVPSINDGGGVQPRPPGSPTLRPETQQQLEALARAQKAPVSEESGKPATETVEVQLRADVEGAKDDLFDMMDFAGKTEAERILNNKKRRQEIEGRCSEITLEDLLLHDEVRQTVPIVPGKYEVVFRTPTPDESLFLKRFLSKESGSDQYVMEKMTLCQLAMGLVSFNGTPLHDHKDDKGECSTPAFEKKLKQLMRKSSYVIADLSVNYVWFDLRVRKLLNPEDLKNG